MQPQKMKFTGVGPIYIAVSLIYTALIMFIVYSNNRQDQIPFVPDYIRIYTGIFMMVVGFPFYIMAIKQVLKAYRATELVTTGVYSFCRHPLYTAWAVFIVPGGVLLINSLIAFTIPVFMWLLLRLIVPKEEAYLENTFGKEYLEYKKRVPCVMPYGFIK